MNNPLVPPLGALALGIYFSSRLAGIADFTAWESLAAALVLCALALAAWAKISVRSARLAMLGGVFWAGVGIETVHRPGPPPEIDFAPGESLALSGCVVDPPALGEDREQLVIELADRARVRVNFYLKEGEKAPVLHYGQRVDLDARLRKPRNYLNPGSFDLAGFLARRDIYWMASATAKSRLEILPGTCGNPILQLVYRLREASIQRLDEIYAGNAYANGMTRAILIGDTARLEKIWIEDFRRTGTYHALVISGLHLTMLTMCFLFFLRILAVGVGWSLVWTSIISWTYALMSGGSAPVVRSAAGLTIYWIGRCFYRRPRVLNLLALVAIVFLVVDPGEMFDASFLLSFLSVAMIGAIAAPLLEHTSDPYAQGTRQLANSRRDLFLPAKVAQWRVELRLLSETIRFVLKIPERVSLASFDVVGRFVFGAWSLFIVSLVVQIGLTLPMVIYFHRVSVTGLTANVLIVPLMNLMVPVGFLAILTGWWVPADFANWLLTSARDVATWHAQREPGFRIPEPPDWLFWFFILALLLLARRWRWGLIPFGAAYFLLVAHPFPPRTDSGWLEVTALDVGQGDSLLIASPQGKLMLVDAGGFPVFGSRKKPSLDIGEDVVSPYLFTRSMKHLDVVVATHAHEDHVGGLRAVIENFHPREVWMGASLMQVEGVPVRRPKAGEKIEWGGAEIEFLSPPEDYEPGLSAKNNDSLAFRLSYGKSSFLFTGDIERPMEQRLVASGLLRPTDVLKVAHHGSKTSSTPQLLDIVKPAWALISDGEGNLFHHPHPSILQRLEERGVQIWRTDRLGQITMRTDGRKWQMESYRLRK